MATLLIHNIPEQELAELDALARQDNVALEEEAICAIRDYTAARRSKETLIPRERLLEEAQALHRDMASQGVCLTQEQIRSAIQEARR